MTEVTNETLYGVLLDIKEDIGGLKATNELHLKALENFGPRISALETDMAKQKGAAKVWGLVATAAASVAGVIGPYVYKMVRGQ